MLAITLALELIIVFEGFSPQPYQDVGTLRWGYGTRCFDAAKTITEPQAREAARQHLERDYRTLNASTPLWADMSPYMQAATLSLSYNMGVTKLRTTTYWKMLAEGRYHLASILIEEFTYSNGKQLRGLIIRRGSEKEMFLRGLTTTTTEGR